MRGIVRNRGMCIHTLQIIETCKYPFSTVKTIGSYAFGGAPLQTRYLPDSVESIGLGAFCHGRFPTVRIPPLITTINHGVL